MGQLIDFGLLMQPKTYEQTNQEWMNPFREMGAGLAEAAKSYAYNKKVEENKKKVQELWDDFNTKENTDLNDLLVPGESPGDVSDEELQARMAEMQRKVAPVKKTAIGQSMEDSPLFQRPEPTQSLIDPSFGQSLVQPPVKETVSEYSAPGEPLDIDGEILREQMYDKKHQDYRDAEAARQARIAELGYDEEGLAKYNRAMSRFKGMDDEQRFMRFAELALPIDRGLAEKMMDIAEERKKYAVGNSKKLLDETQQAFNQISTQIFSTTQQADIYKRSGNIQEAQRLFTEAQNLEATRTALMQKMKVIAPDVYGELDGTSGASGGGRWKGFS